MWWINITTVHFLIIPWGTILWYLHTILWHYFWIQPYQSSAFCKGMLLEWSDNFNILISTSFVWEQDKKTLLIATIFAVSSLPKPCYANLCSTISLPYLILYLNAKKSLFIGLDYCFWKTDCFLILRKSELITFISLRLSICFL